MRKFFQQLAGAQPFAPVQPTPSADVHVPQRVVAPAAEPLTAFPFVVKEEQPGLWSAKFVPEERKASPKRPAAMALDDDEDDGSDLGEEGGVKDLLDKAEIEAEDRREQSEAPRKKLKRIKKAKKPITATKQGKPDRRQKIYVTDELDEKHDEPLPPVTEPLPLPVPDAPVQDPLHQGPVSVPREPAPSPEPVQVPVPREPSPMPPVPAAVEDAMLVEVPKAGVLARFFKFR